LFFFEFCILVRPPDCEHIDGLWVAGKLIVFGGPLCALLSQPCRDAIEKDIVEAERGSACAGGVGVGNEYGHITVLEHRVHHSDRAHMAIAVTAGQVEADVRVFDLDAFPHLSNHAGQLCLFPIQHVGCLFRRHAYPSPIPKHLYGCLDVEKLESLGCKLLVAAV